MRRAAVFAVVSAALLIALGIPFLGVKFTGIDASVLQVLFAGSYDSNARQVNMLR